MTADSEGETQRVPPEVLDAIDSLAHGETATKEDLASVLKFGQGIKGDE